MKKKNLILIIVCLAIVICVIIGTCLFSQKGKPHDKEALLTSFIGEWKEKDDSNVTLTVTETSASFRIASESTITYEDCTYILNDDDKFELDGVSEDFTCELNSKYTKLTCKSENTTYHFAK